MHYAASGGGHVEIIRHLATKMESLLHETDKDGCNMVHLAAQEGHADVVQLVIDKYKLDSTARDKVSMYSQVSYKVHCL